VQSWDKVFKSEGKYFLQPEKEVRQLIAVLKKHKVKKILDLGCGTGRHLVYLAKRGFDVYGLDESRTGLKIARKWLKDEQLTAHLKICDLYNKYPFKNEFFDAVISTRAIHHGSSKNVKKAIKEVSRVLKPNGIIFIIVPTSSKTQSVKSKKVEPHVYVPLEGHEKGLPHLIFNKSLIKEYFRNFKIENIFINEIDKNKKFYCFTGLKN
jgi:ubiquinone/menaquinone biosynthesis C-methylase UbiE